MGVYSSDFFSIPPYFFHFFLFPVFALRLKNDKRKKQGKEKKTGKREKNREKRKNREKKRKKGKDTQGKEKKSAADFA